jgi:hypothetical protein
MTYAVWLILFVLARRLALAEMSRLGRCERAAPYVGYLHIVLATEAYSSGAEQSIRGDESALIVCVCAPYSGAAVTT